MCVAMMSVQPKWSTTRYSAARSQRACHSAALIPEGSAVATALIAASPLRGWKAPILLLVPERVAPAVADGEGGGQPQARVDQGGRGVAQARDERPRREQAQRQAPDGEHADAHHPAAHL